MTAGAIIGGLVSLVVFLFIARFVLGFLVFIGRRVNNVRWGMKIDHQAQRRTAIARRDDEVPSFWAVNGRRAKAAPPRSTDELWLEGPE